MTFNKTKWMTISVAVCFAVLQALQPLIHGHLDAEHSIQHTGFHLGDEHEEAVVSHQAAEISHSVTTAPHISHTISVASGMKQEVNPIIAAEFMWAILVVIASLVALQTKTLNFNHSNFNLYQSLRLKIPASRAPPSPQH